MTRAALARAALVLAASLALAAPVAAQSLATLLPVLSFPDETVTPSTKGCEAQAAAPSCRLEE